MGAPRCRRRNLLLATTFSNCHPEQREGSAFCAGESISFAALRMTCLKHDSVYGTYAVLAAPKQVARNDYLTNSGDNQRGSARKISGATIIKISTANIGINIIITSLMTSTMRTFAIAQDIIKHKP